jgi:hypothetical protein
MRATVAILVLGGLLLGGCGSDEDKKKREEAEKKREWCDYGPGDPRGDIKALKKAREVVKEAEKSRQLPEDEPLGETESK